MPLRSPLPLAKLEALAALHGTPFQLYDEGAIRANARGLIAAFSAQFPGFRQFFAVKALPNPAILAALVDEGCGLDCSSTAELHIAQLLGVPGSAIMYTSNYTSAKVCGRRRALANYFPDDWWRDSLCVCDLGGTLFRT